MSTLTQRLLDDFPTVRAILAGVVRWHSNCCYPKHLAEIFQPTAEVRPRRIRNRFEELGIFNHVSHLQVLIGNQVVRLDYAPCQLHGKVFTLPAYLEVLSTQAISTLESVFRAFSSARKFFTQAFKRFFRLSQVVGIFYCLSVGIGIEVSQPNIQPNGFTCWLSLLDSVLVKTKLNVVPVSPTHNPDSLNLFQLVEVQVTSSPQLKASGFKPIGENDGSSICQQLPSRRFVFDATVGLMLLKLWEALLSWLAFLAVVVEPSNRTPSSFSRCLSGLRVKLSGKRKLLSKNGAISAQFVLTSPLVIHPVSNATVANKSSSTNSFIKPFILLLCSLKFCLKYQHDYAGSLSVSVP